MKELKTGEFGVIEIRNGIVVPVAGKGFKADLSFAGASLSDVLYVPESAFEDFADCPSDGVYGYTKADFLKIVGADPENPSAHGEALAAELFDTIEWQEPESLFERFKEEEYVLYCPSCGWFINLLFDEGNIPDPCPYCGGPL